VSGASARDDPLLARDHRGHIDLHRSVSHAPAHRIARIAGYPGASDHGFGGGAAGVDAGASELVALDKRDSPAVNDQLIGERITTLSWADHNGGVCGHPAYSPEKGLL